LHKKSSYKNCYIKTKKDRLWPFFADRLIKDSPILFLFFDAFLVGNRAGRFASRLAARLALAASGVFAHLDARFLNGLHMLHGIYPPKLVLSFCRC
jgi:hypothetical protein